MKIGFGILVSLLHIFASAQTGWTIFNKTNSALPGNEINCLAKDSLGNIWIGTEYGLVKYDGIAFQIFDSSNSGLPSNQIISIGFDFNQNVWVGTLQAGYSVFDGINWSNFNAQNSVLPDNQVGSIAFDTLGKAWIGTAGGILHQSDEGWIVYNIFNSPLGSDNIKKIFIASDNQKWIGTVNGGITRIDGNTWTVYNNTNSGISDNTINDLTDDIFGNIWFATPAQGLGRFDGSSWFFRNDFNSTIPTNSLTCLLVSKRTDEKYIGSFDKGFLKWNNGFLFDSFTVNNSPMPGNRVSCLLQYDDTTFYIGTNTSGMVKWIDTSSYVSISNLTYLELTYSELTLFPNPASHQVNLAVDGSICSGNLEIFNAQGGLVKVVFIQESQQLDVENLQSGVYYARICSNGDTLIRKFIVAN